MVAVFEKQTDGFSGPYAASEFEARSVSVVRASKTSKSRNEPKQAKIVSYTHTNTTYNCLLSQKPAAELSSALSLVCQQQRAPWNSLGDLCVFAAHDVLCPDLSQADDDKDVTLASKIAQSDWPQGGTGINGIDNVGGSGSMNNTRRSSLDDLRVGWRRLTCQDSLPSSCRRAPFQRIPPTSPAVQF